MLLILTCQIALAQSHPGDKTKGVTATLQQVADIHEAAGVFAVAGCRMGERALHELGQARGSFALDVTHRTPLKVQYSCIADGWQAATSVSAGKLNLHLAEVPPDKMETQVMDRDSGQGLIFRLRPAFLTTYLNLPSDKQAAAARRVALCRMMGFYIRKSEDCKEG